MPGEQGEYHEQNFEIEVANFKYSFVRESWSLYGVAVIIILLRFFARWKRFGFRGAKLDDGFMLFALGTFTTMTYGINHLLNRGVETSFIAPEQLTTMTQPEIDDVIENAKWIYVCLHLQVLTLWACKACMVIIYLRITDGLVARRWLMAVGAYVGISWVGTELAVFLSCLPIQKRWEIGMDASCSFYDNYQEAEAVFSATSTALILIVGLPVLLKARLPSRQKMIVSILFGLGVFDLAADIVTHVFITQVSTYGFTYYAWYMRVNFVALLVCNLPYTWSLIIDTFPGIRTWSSENSMNSAPKFWTENKWYGPLVCCGGQRRKAFVHAPSTMGSMALKDTRTVDSKHSEAPLDEKDPRMDAAVVNRMIDGELEDEIDLEKSGTGLVLAKPEKCCDCGGYKAAKGVAH